MITMTITSMISIAIVIRMIIIMMVMMIESRSQGTSLLLMVEKEVLASRMSKMLTFFCCFRCVIIQMA